MTNPKLSGFLKKINTSDSIWFFLGVSVLFLSLPILVPSVDMFIYPGIFIIFSGYRKKKEFAETLVYAAGISLSFWVVSFNFLSFFNINLFAWVRSAVFILKGVFVYLLVQNRGKIELGISRDAAFDVMLLVYVVILRMLLLNFVIAPSGADMSMHCYMARLIYENNGMPISHEPILSINTFGACSHGFSVLIAIFSFLAKMSIYRSGVVLTSIAYSFLTFGLYIFLNRCVRSRYNLLVSIIVTLFTVYPQAGVSPGGNSFVFSLFFAVMFMVTFADLLEDKKFLFVSALSAMVFAAAVLIHPNLPVMTAYLVLLILPVYLIRASFKGAAMKGYAMRLCLFLLFLSFLLLPYLVNLKLNLSPAESEWIVEFEKHGLNFPDMMGINDIGTVLNEVLRYVMGYFGGVIDYLGVSNSLIIYLLGLILIFSKKPALGFVSLFICASLTMLTINSRYRFLPLSPLAFYKDRIVLLYTLPLVLSAAYLFQCFMDNLSKRYIKIFFIFIVLFFSFYLNRAYFINAACSDTTVTESDLAAFKWIERNTEAGSVFQNSYGDAGLWIPAIVYRKILTPHVHIVYMDEFRESGKDLKADYVYCGKKAVYGSSLPRQEFERDNVNYEKVYSEGGVDIYRRKGT